MDLGFGLGKPLGTDSYQGFMQIDEGAIVSKGTATVPQPSKHPAEFSSCVPYIVGMNNTEGQGYITDSFPRDFKSGISEESCKISLRGYIGGSLYVSAVKKILFISKVTVGIAK